MAIKKLQKDYTTPEQSKWLLELGLPADSSNMYYRSQISTPYVFNKGITFSRYSKVEDILPCWSVGRLIEIYVTCIEHYTGDERLTFGRDTIRLGMMDCIIAAIEVGCEEGDMDFSKLEE